MKKLSLLTLLLIVMFCHSAKAQDEKNEFHLNWSPGFFGYQFFYELSVDIIDDIFSSIGSDNDTDETYGGTGIIRLGYDRFITDRFAIGLDGSYVSYTISKEYQKDGESLRKVKWRDSFISVLARANYYYVKKENVSMYSGLMAGVSFTQSKTISGLPEVELGENTLFAFHVNAFGIRWGRALGFSLEAGFGYNGILNAGMNYRF